MFTKKWWFFFCLGIFVFSLWDILITKIPGISSKWTYSLGTLMGIGIAWYCVVGIPFLLKLQIFREGMREEDVKIGMKVVPFRKTVSGWQSLEEALSWKNALSKGQPYLYVLRWHEEVECFLLCDDPSAKEGDFFNSRDFYPYKEPTSV